jgi:RNA polymerase sigma-70 factor, ECF subfamily
MQGLPMPLRRTTPRSSGDSPSLSTTCTAARTWPETYLRAYRAWSRFDGRDVRRWLYTIGLRLAFNERDRRRRWAGLLGHRQALEPWVDAYDPQLTHAMAALDRRQRAALMLSAVDGYTQSEIASMLNVRPGTVASWLSRAKATLRQELADD